MASVKLDAAQQAAVCHIDGPFLCIAGPGSGKTTVMVHRVAHMVNAGIDPVKILVLTFGREAARELKERYAKLPGAKAGVTFSTIHAFALRVVMDQPEYKGWNVLDTGTQYGCFKDLLKKLKFEDFTDLEHLLKSLNADLDHFREIPEEERTRYKGKTFETPREFQWFRSQYEAFKQKEHYLDFPDMLYEARRILQERPWILSFYQNYYHYIMVDEFQDTSVVQADLIYMLAAPKNNLFICGDEDQSIYEWRDAKPKIMLSFEERFPGCGVAKLTTNYRSDATIIEAAGQLISHNKVRFDKEITGNSENPGTIRIVVTDEKDPKNSSFLMQIRTLKDEGTPYTQIAVLTRTNREAAGIAVRCFQENIPFTCLASIQNPYRGPLFRTIMDYLEIAFGNDDWEVIRRVINKPSRYIKAELVKKAKSLDDLLEQVNAQPMPGARRLLKEFCANIPKIRAYAASGKPLSLIMEKIWGVFRLDDYVANLSSYLAEDPDLLQEQYEALLDEAAAANSFADFKAWAKIHEQIFERSTKDQHGVTISTMHRAKGMEWDAVLIPSCFNGNIPFQRKHEEFTEEMEESERRLFYVGITRARNSCTLFLDHSRRPSQFLAESGLTEKAEKEPEERAKTAEKAENVTVIPESSKETDKEAKPA